MSPDSAQHRQILERIADRAMTEAGLLPNFSREALTELARLNAPAAADADVRDLTQLLWCSIDNDDSLDLDQLTVAEALPDGKVRILVAIADVDSLVKERSAINEHAEHNTTSVYTAARMYPMLPEKLSTGLTSLNLNEDRLAVVMDMVIAADGTVLESKIYRARVRSKAKLAYNSVAAWLDGSGDEPPAITAVPGLAENLRLQDKTAQSMKNYRHLHGALSLETIEAKPVFDGDQLSALEIDEKNRAKQIIEDFMVAANGVTARFLAASKFASIRRVVRVPKRWDRIVELAAQHGAQLPDAPDSKALEEFLVQQRAADPVRLPRSVAVCDQAAGFRRIRRRSCGWGRAGALRIGGQGLHPFDGAQSALPGPDHAAPAEGCPGRRNRRPTAKRRWMHWRRIAPRPKMWRPKWSDAWRNRRRRSCWSRASASSSTRW